MSSLETIDVASLTRLAVDAFRRAGLSAEHAAISADILVEADMMGLGTHGVVRVPAYANRRLPFSAAPTIRSLLPR